MQIVDLPCPRVGRGQVLIETRASLISAGTEGLLVEFSQANLLQKARQRPDRVKQVLDKMKTDGVLPTLEAVFRKLDEPLPLGYCNAGVVLQIGRGVYDLQPGDRVASNGPHAEVVCVPRNLCARIPNGLGDEEAAFTVLGAIALQGIRLAQPTLGERFVVLGMGILGLVTVQLLRASGCHALAVDLIGERLELAEAFGAKAVNVAKGGDPIAAARAWTEGSGVDGAIITASAKSDSVIHQAAEVCRKQGRIILVGVVNLNLRRSDFYEKELTFQVSCSYGPGRYDEQYEQEGHDYPRGLVRWTEQRNFEAVVEALQNGALKVDRLITDRYELANATTAYEKTRGDGSSLGVLLKYDAEVNLSTTTSISKKSRTRVARNATVGVIGAGSFSRSILLPALSRTQARLAWLADLNSAAAQHAARKFGAERVTTDYRTILNDEEVSAVFIAVGHHLHARLVCETLEADKHVFVEKPLCLNPEELEDILSQLRAKRSQDLSLLTVAFNRRFSPHTEKAKWLLQGRVEPLAINITVNAGEIPADHWTQDPQRGGGRIIGEGCHFLDLMVFLAGSKVRTIAATRMGEGTVVRDDKVSITLGFEDGSVGALNYFGNGCTSYPKETVEIFSDRRVIRIENFRRTITSGYGRGKTARTLRQDKGHQAQFRAFVDRVAGGGRPLIPLDELVNVTLASFAAVNAAREERTIKLAEEYPKLWPLAFEERPDSA